MVCLHQQSWLGHTGPSPGRILRLFFCPSLRFWRVEASKVRSARIAPLFAAWSNTRRGWPELRWRLLQICETVPRVAMKWQWWNQFPLCGLQSCFWQGREGHHEWDYFQFGSTHRRFGLLFSKQVLQIHVRARWKGCRMRTVHSCGSICIDGNLDAQNGY